MKKIYSLFKFVLFLIILIVMINPISLGYIITLSDHLKVNDSQIEKPWPMFCHDVRHTGRSPYSTANNPGIIKWKFRVLMGVESSAAIDENGMIYFGSNEHFLHALYPNGLESWRFDCGDRVLSSPSIATDGTIYVGSEDGNLYAVNPDGSLKWKFDSAGEVRSSPVIGEDGTIYFGVLGPGTRAGRIYAINPDGSEKWYYDTGHYIFQNAAIGDDETVYASSCDNKIYALNPDNGTLKWMFKMGGWPGSPSIGDDGIIYVPNNDDFLYAIYPNGTLKWKNKIGSGSLQTPSIDEDGTIYIGRDKLYAVNPDGTMKWSFTPEDEFHISTSTAISSNGIIYCGITKGIKRGDLIAINPDGDLRWRVEGLGNDVVYSSPSIDSDGTVYISGLSTPYTNCFFYAINDYDSNAPTTPVISGPNSGGGGKVIEFNFTSTSLLGRDLYYWIDWGDGEIEEWIGPFDSGITITKIHTWSDDKSRTYTIKARSKDTENLWGPISEFNINIKPRNHAIYNFWQGFQNMFPILQRILGFIK